MSARRWQLQTSGPQDSVHVFSGFDAVLLPELGGQHDLAFRGNRRLHVT
jgi:hypothetical protein